MIDFNAYNDAVKNWGRITTAAVRNSGNRFGITHLTRSNSPGDSLTSIKEKFRTRAGMVDAVIIGNINRSLIYTAAGAGKGRGGIKGSRWVDKYGIRRSTHPDSMGKAGTGGRRKKPFIEEVLDGPQGVDALGDIVAGYQADAVVESVYLK